LPVDLIRDPRGGDVLWDVGTGPVPRSGDL